MTRRLVFLFFIVVTAATTSGVASADAPRSLGKQQRLTECGCFVAAPISARRPSRFASTVRLGSNPPNDESSSSEEHQRHRHRRLLEFEHWGVEQLRLSSTSTLSPSGTSASPPSLLPSCPSTFRQVANDAYRAIAGTACGLQRPDPNAAVNAMHRSVMDYRPVHPPSSSARVWAAENDHGAEEEETAASAAALSTAQTAEAAEFSGRMGIEIDGAACLFDNEDGDADYDYYGDTGDDAGPPVGGQDEGRALRILSLEIALRLASSHWDGFEEDGFEEEDEEQRPRLKRKDVKGNGDVGGDEDAIKKGRPVAVYYNSLEQTLLAARELRRMKLRQKNRQQQLPVRRRNRGSSNDEDDPTLALLEQIYVCRLGKELPDCMARKKMDGRRKSSDSSSSKGSETPRKGRGRPRANHQRFQPDPKNGMVLVVNPTDCEEGRSPAFLRPAPDATDMLQRTLVRASSSALPAVVMTPRLTELSARQQAQRRSSSGLSLDASFPGMLRSSAGSGGGEGWNGDGGGHPRAAVYGGAEPPPPDPAPWLMRDLAPPAYAWVGCAVDVSPFSTMKGRGEGRGGVREGAGSQQWGRFRRGMARSYRPSPQSIIAAFDADDDNDHNDGGGGGDLRHRRDDGESKTYTFYSRLAIAQSSMDAGHPWHMFAVKETVVLSPSSSSPSSSLESLSERRRQRTSSETTKPRTKLTTETMGVDRKRRYRYMASTKPSSGRPTRSIVRDVFDEWIHGEDNKFFAEGREKR